MLLPIVGLDAVYLGWWLSMVVLLIAAAGALTVLVLAGRALLGAIRRRSRVPPPRSVP